MHETAILLPPETPFTSGSLLPLNVHEGPVVAAAAAGAVAAPATAGAATTTAAPHDSVISDASRQARIKRMIPKMCPLDLCTVVDRLPTTGGRRIPLLP